MRIRSIVLTLLFGLCTVVNSARAADAGDYAPANIDHTMGRLKWLCMLPMLCPLSDKALVIIDKARAGDPSYEYLLGLALLVGDDLPTDRVAGVAWIVRAAEAGDPDAARDIAARLRNGEAIEVDETKIFAALKPRADRGEPEAMRALGPMYIGGRGVKQDPAAGLALMRGAAEKGSTGAEVDLSQLYLNGAPGVPKDRPEAMKWLAASANHGNLAAMVNLGYMTVNGSMDAPRTDLVAGYCWLMRAALLDQPQAQEKLTSLLSDGAKDSQGSVIDADIVQADFWFRVAARSPYHDNSQIRARIEPHMTTDQLNQAKHLFEGWHPRSLQEIRTLSIALPPPLHGNCAPMQ